MDFGGRVVVAVVILLSLAPTRAQDTPGPSCGPSNRRAWRDLTCQQQDNFLNAVHLLKESGYYDEFVYTHWWYNEWTHFTPIFLPWHRYFIWMFERALQQVTNSCITLPYWDWERDAGAENDSILLDSETFGSFDGAVQNRLEGSCSWITWGSEECLHRDIGGPGSSGLSGEAQVLAIVTNYNQYQDTSNPDNGEENNGFADALEGTPHRRPHNFIGGDMQGMFAPDDPLFYLHHANVDRIWALWQDYWGHDEILFADRANFVDPLHYANDERWPMDDPMPFPGEHDTEWQFSLPAHRNIGIIAYPSPRQVLSNWGPLLKVRYVNDHLASLLPRDDYVPNPRWFRAARGDVVTRCGRRRRKEQEDTTSYLSSISSFDSTTTAPGLASIEFNATKPDPSIPSSGNCAHQINFFTRLVDRNRWVQLCQELSPSTTLAERLAILAEMDCADEMAINKLDQERYKDEGLVEGSAAVPPNATQSHHAKNPDGNKLDGLVEGWRPKNQAAMECFHRPDL